MKRAAAEQSKSKTLPLSYILLGSNVIIYSAGITQAINHGVEDAQNWFGACQSVCISDHRRTFAAAVDSRFFKMGSQSFTEAFCQIWLYMGACRAVRQLSAGGAAAP